MAAIIGRNYSPRFCLVVCGQQRQQAGVPACGSWLALDVETREIVGVYVAQRSRDGTQGLGNALPAVYRQCAVAYTDFWSAYDAVFPSKRHQSVGKDSGKTSYVERFNCTLRQRVSRLVRKTLSFSKKLENHIGAIWYCVHHYNTSLLV